MPGPLATLKVLDFTTLLPGPYATMLLADLGAEVVRVEAPHRPDLLRLAPPYDGDGQAVGHAVVNRSKRSLALDLKQAGAAAVVRRLVQAFDIVIEGFRPGVMDRLGVGYAALAEENPGLIYVSITAYGQTGPLRDRAGHDLNVLALAGVLSHTGGAAPVPPAVPWADLAGGSLHAVVALLAAVVHRNATGEGQHVDVSLLDGTRALDGLATAAALEAGRPPGYATEPLNGGSFYDVYRTEDGRYLAVGSLEPKFWMGFCEALGRPDLIDRGFDVWDPAQQRRLKAEIQEILGARPLAHWRAVFAELDVCVEPVLTVEEAMTHPQVAARAMIAEVPRPDTGGAPQRQPASPFRFSKTAPAYRHPGAPLGAHTTAVLAEAGFSEAEIGALHAAGVVGAETPVRHGST